MVTDVVSKLAPKSNNALQVQVGRSSDTRIRFTIVITCHNQKEFIRDAVDSVLFQPVAAKEIIVVDDASTDGSSEILRQYGDSIHLEVLPKNFGAVGARNHGASLAKGEYPVFLDGDDALTPWALGIYDQIVQLKHPKMILGRLLFFSGAVRSIKGEGTPRDVEVVEYETFMRKDRAYRASASSIVVDRQKFLDAGGWSAGMFPIEDVDLVTKLGYIGNTVMIMSPRTIFYRIHETNAIHKVDPFMPLVQKIISKARTGEYPHDVKSKFEMYAFVGGPIAFWARKAFRNKFYKDSFKIVWNGRTMILAAILRRLASKIKGQRPAEAIALEL